MTRRLVNTVAEHWPRFDGEMALQGFDPLDLPFDRFISLLYAWMTKDLDEAGLAKFDAQLWQPVKGVEIPAESPWSPENEQKAFAAFKSSVQGG